MWRQQKRLLARWMQKGTVEELNCLVDVEKMGDISCGVDEERDGTRDQFQVDVETAEEVSCKWI